MDKLDKFLKIGGKFLLALVDPSVSINNKILRGFIGIAYFFCLVSSAINAFKPSDDEEVGWTVWKWINLALTFLPLLILVIAAFIHAIKADEFY